MIIVSNKDLFDSEREVIAHCVNCQGVMGSGVAREVKAKYPSVYREYTYYLYEKGIRNSIGTVQIVPTEDGRFIANMFGQVDYGSSGVVWLKYKRFEDTIKQLAEYCRKNCLNVAMPYNIGCGRAGGQWSIVYSMLKANFDTLINSEGCPVILEICRI